MSRCKIHLDSIGTLSPGDSVYGRVICRFSETEKVREIRCTLEGKETTKFSKKKGKHRRWYYGNRHLFGLKIILHDEGTIQKGIYEYPFSFTLPSILPSSYQDEHGNIRYFIIANVDIPLAFDPCDELTINVNAPINMNTIRQELLLEPAFYKDEKVLCCWCCNSAPIKLTVNLEKNAFLIGETVKIKVEIINLSGTNVEQLIIKLTKNIQYHCDKYSETHFVKFPITYTNASGVGAHGQRTYLINFQIPETLTVHNFALCTLIKDAWLLEAEAVLPGCHTNLVVPAKIIIGQIPLGNSDTQTFSPSAPLSTPPGDKQDPLPSYYEATREEEASAPLYPSAPSK